MTEKLTNQKFGVKELYIALYNAIRTFSHVRKNKKAKKMSPHFIKRIMLAVTEVNGCDVCSYVHTKSALEQGMSPEEINMILSGDTKNIPDEEATAILFSQHYADARGNPSEDAWSRIVQTYGTDKALGILGATRIIMFGNIFGIALGGLKNRLLGKKTEGTSLLYELKMIGSMVILVPTALIHSLLSKLFNSPVIYFNEEDTLTIK